MKYSISPAKIEDVNALDSLERRVFVPSDGPLNKRSFRYHIRNDKNLLLVALPDEPPTLLLGYILVFLSRKSARIYSLAICPELQGKGIGRALILDAIDKILEKGITAIRLELRKDNANALKLYSALGFVPSGIRADYYGPKEDAILMTWNKQP